MKGIVNTTRRKICIPVGRLFLFFGVLSVIGCSYNFSKDNFFEIEQPKLENTSIDLNNFTNLDTINVLTDFRYTFTKEPEQSVIQSDVFFDGQKIGANFADQTGTFTLDPARYDDGTHTIRMEQTFSSGTGSLADQAQVEVFTVTKEVQFIIHRNPSPPPVITEAVNQDGTIYLEWDAPQNAEYKYAYLSLQYIRREIRIPLSEEMLSLGTYNDTQTVLWMANTNSPNYDDFESVTYSIVFESDYTELYGEAQALTYDPSMVTMKIVFTDFNSYKIKWSAHPQYANFDNFEFSNIQGTFSGSSEGDEYLVTSPYVFGEKYSAGGRPINTELFLPYYSFRELEFDEETFGLFDLYPHFAKDILYNPSTDHYYVLVVEQSPQSNAAMYIYEYSDEMEFVKKIFIANYDSGRDEYLKLYLDPIDNNFYLDARTSSYMIDKMNLTIIKQYKDPPNTSEVSLRNNILKTWQYSNDLLTIRNTDTNAIIYSGVTFRPGYLSRSGEYVHLITQSEEAIYKIVNDQLVKVMDVNISSTIYQSNIHIEGDTIFYTVNNEIFIVDLNTLVSKSFLFKVYPPVIQYDPFSRKLLLSQNGIHGIYDLQTEQLTEFSSETYKSTSGYYWNSDRDYRMHLQNGRLIHSKGIYIDLD